MFLIFYLNFFSVWIFDEKNKRVISLLMMLVISFRLLINNRIKLMKFVGLNYIVMR